MDPENGRGLPDTVACPTGAILDTWCSHSWTEGLQLEYLRHLEWLSVRTRNSVYDIIIVRGETGEILVRGGAFFPAFTSVRLVGSTLGGSFLKLRGIYVGFRMELHLDRQAIVTSQVQSIGVRMDADEDALAQLMEDGRDPDRPIDA